MALLAAALAGGTLGGERRGGRDDPGRPGDARPLSAGQRRPRRCSRCDRARLRRRRRTSDARVRDGDGGTDQRFNVPTPPGSTLLWGDWNRDGAVTPVVFTNGHWVIYDAMVGPAPVPSPRVRLRRPGRPARRRRLQPRRPHRHRRGPRQRLAAAQLPVGRRRPGAGSAFGAATDVPVTGDWNGDGRDGVGVRRGAKCFLLQAPKARAGQPTYTFRFGAATDVAVTGDWNGDGADTAGRRPRRGLVPAGPRCPAAGRRA